MYFFVFLVLVFFSGESFHCRPLCASACMSCTDTVNDLVFMTADRFKQIFGNIAVIIIKPNSLASKQVGHSLSCAVLAFGQVAVNDHTWAQSQTIRLRMLTITANACVVLAIWVVFWHRIATKPSSADFTEYLLLIVMQTVRYYYYYYYHSGNVSSSSVNGDIAFLWEWSNFDHS